MYAAQIAKRVISCPELSNIIPHANASERLAKDNVHDRPKVCRKQDPKSRYKPSTISVRLCKNINKSQPLGYNTFPEMRKQKARTQPIRPDIISAPCFCEKL